MAWYQNPTIAAVLGAIAGSIVSGIVSVSLWRRTQRFKRIDCMINDVSSLMSVSEKIRDQLTVRYEGNPVESVYLISVDVVCTGNLAVENQPVQIRLSSNSNIIDYSISKTPPVGFGEVKELKKDGYALDLEVELFNPQDAISMEIVSIDNDSDKVDVYMKNANVETRIFERHGPQDNLGTLISDRNLMFLEIMSFIPIFGGMARSMISLILTQRLNNLSEKR